ncbi:MAG: roadblock/LC7 domain-containing protein [Gammaproteobacteria bacterium]
MKIKNFSSIFGRKPQARNSNTDQILFDDTKNSQVNKDHTAGESDGFYEQINNKFNAELVIQESDHFTNDPITEEAEKTENMEEINDDLSEYIPLANRLSEEQKSSMKSFLEQLAGQNNGVYGAFVSSIDGNEIVTFTKRDLPTSRMANMTSSLLALGETIARESQQNICQFVILENTDGRIVSLRINDNMMLTCISTPKTNLGMLLSSGRIIAEGIGKIV